MRIHFPKILYSEYPSDEFDRRLTLGYKYIPSILYSSASHQIHITNPIYQGYGTYDGTVTKQDVPIGKSPVSVFHKETGVRIYRIIAQADGSFHFRNLAKGQPLLFVAEDPDKIFNSVAQDIVL